MDRIHYDFTPHERLFLNTGNDCYICDHCHRVVYVANRNQVEVDITSEIKGIRIDKARLDLHIKCLDCNDWMFQCDKDIANRISLLNKYGIETLYCCSGHIEVPYYLFNNDKDEEYKYFLEMPYLAFSTNVNESFIDLIKGMLLLQEYSFITFEDKTDDCDMYVIRGSLFGEVAISLTKDEDISNYSIEFNTMCNAFYKFVDDLIDQIKE